MKHLITLSLLVACLTASAQTVKSTLPLITKEKQTKPDLDLTKPTPPQYKKVVVIDVQDYQTLTGALNDSKSGVIYNPGMTAEQKVTMQQQIDAYLRELPKRVKLDSLLVGGKP